MTREEAISILKKGTRFEPTLENKDYPEAFEMAVKALEQEPCEDAISRQAAIDAVAKLLAERCGGNVAWWKPVAKSVIDDLPPVNKQEPKTGQWDKGYTFPDGDYWKCTNCNELIKVKFPMNYCNNCGAKMEGTV